jgi:hypothetical protein
MPSRGAVIVSAILAKLDFLDELIAGLSVEIGRGAAPFSRHIDLLDTIHGVDLCAAQGLLAEIGVDMGRSAGPQIGGEPARRSEPPATVAK